MRLPYPAGCVLATGVLCCQHALALCPRHSLVQRDFHPLAANDFAARLSMLQPAERRIFGRGGAVVAHLRSDGRSIW